MANPRFKITADEKALVDSLEHASKEAADVFEENVKKAAARSAKHIENMVGKETFKGAGGSKGIEKYLADQLKVAGRSAQMKDATKGMSESLAKQVSKDFGAKISAKDIQKVLNKTVEDTEKASKEGLFSRLLFGKAGPQRFKSQFDQTTKTMGRSIAHNIQAPMMGVLGGTGGALAAGGLGGAKAGASLVSPGILGGAAGAVGMLGLAGIGLAGAAAAGAVSYGRKEETIRQKLAPMMDVGTGGSRAMGRNARGQFQGMISEGRAAEYLPEELSSMIAPALKVGAGKDLGSIIKAERGFGMGGDVTAMLGAQSMRGGRIAKGQGSQELQKVIEAAMASKLEKGRWGELARGMASMVSSKGMGISADTTAIVEGLKGIREGFRGQEGIQVLQGMETAATGGKTPLGRAAALQAAGLGRSGLDFGHANAEGVGGNIFAAEKQMELGMFGTTTRKRRSEGGGLEEFTKSGGGVEVFKEILNTIKQTAGFGAEEEVGLAKGDAGSEEEIRRDSVIKQMAMNMGLTMNATEKLINAVEVGNTTQEEMEKIVDSGKSLQDQAYKAMIDMAKFKGLEVAFDRLMANLFKTLQPLIDRLIVWIERGIVTTETMLKYLRKSEMLTGGEDPEKKARDKRNEERALELFSATPEAAKESKMVAGRLAKKYGEAAPGVEGGEEGFRKAKYLQYFQETGEMPEAGAKGAEQVKKFQKLSKEEGDKLGGGLSSKDINGLVTALVREVIATREAQQVEVVGSISLVDDEGKERGRTELRQKKSQRANRGPLSPTLAGAH